MLRPGPILAVIILGCCAFFAFVRPPQRVAVPPPATGAYSAPGPAASIAPSTASAVVDSFAATMKRRGEALQPYELAVVRAAKRVEDGATFRDDCNAVIVASYALRSAIGDLPDTAIKDSLNSAAGNFEEGGMACLRSEPGSPEVILMTARAGIGLAQDLMRERYGVAPLVEMDMNAPENQAPDAERGKSAVAAVARAMGRPVPP